jgi:hypothetical protein
MGFVVGVIAALLVIFLLSYVTVKKPAFGRVLIAISVLLVLLSTYLYHQKEDRVELRHQLISVNQIKLSDVNFKYAYGSYFRLTGQVENQSTKYRLQAVDLRLKFYRCEQERMPIAECELVEEMVHEAKTRLAAENSGKFESYLLLDTEKFKKLRLDVEVISGTAR